jgi:hypothetical protein
VRNERPADYLKVIASLMPKEVHLKDESAVAALSEEEITQGLAAVNAALASRAHKFLDDGTPTAGNA